MRSSLTRSAFVASAAAITLAVGATLPVSAGVAVGYTVPDGIEVIEVALEGARGGDGDRNFNAFGGAGCTVTASLPVVPGDAMSWILGTSGGDVTASATNAPGGVGGAGARPGGNGGPVAQISGTAAPGGGGGGASSLSVAGTELIVAAGGGGGGGRTGAGVACSGLPEGENGFGTTPTAGGGKTADVGGAAGLGNGGTSTPPPGNAGNSATDSPPGKGGDGGTGNFGGPGGGGGGGGISGGGGGAGQNGGFSSGNGTGAGGLSGAPEAPEGIASPTFTGGEARAGAVRGSAVVIETSDLPAGTAGTPYSATLSGALELVFNDEPLVPTSMNLAAVDAPVTWTLAGDSALPAGLTIDPSGSITGTPTDAGTTEVTLAAIVFNDLGEIRARSVVTLAIEVAGASPTTTTEAPTTTSEATTTTASGGGSGTLPATGASSVAPLVAAGVLLVGSGGAAALLANRRRRA